MTADTAGGGLSQLEDHYKTFIVSFFALNYLYGCMLTRGQTEKDFADIAGAGLNYIRVPIGYWAIEKRSNEPYLQGVSWQ